MLCTVNFTEELTGRVIHTNVQKQHIQFKNVKQHNFLVMVIISLIQVFVVEKIW